MKPTVTLELVDVAGTVLLAGPGVPHGDGRRLQIAPEVADAATVIRLRDQDGELIVEAAMVDNAEADLREAVEGLLQGVAGEYGPEAASEFAATLATEFGR